MELLMGTLKDKILSVVQTFDFYYKQPKSNMKMFKEKLKRCRESINKFLEKYTLLNKNWKKTFTIIKIFETG